MTRKPAAVNRREQNLIRWYKWEFLRRNPEYRKEHKNFMRRFGPWFRDNGAWYDRTKTWDATALRFFEETIAPEMNDIGEQWQISDPFSPDWDFEKSGLRRINSFVVVAIPTELFEGDPGKVWDIPRRSATQVKRREEFVKRMKARRAKVRRAEHDLVLTLDLRRPLPRLLREAGYWIRIRKKKYDVLHPKPVPTVRRRLDHYDLYLRVWDLRAQKRTFAAIGKVVFPNQLSATQHAIDSFRRAKQLIEGGYKELR